MYLLDAFLIQLATKKKKRESILSRRLVPQNSDFFAWPEQACLYLEEWTWCHGPADMACMDVKMGQTQKPKVRERKSHAH